MQMSNFGDALELLDRLKDQLDYLEKNKTNLNNQLTKDLKQLRNGLDMLLDF